MKCPRCNGEHTRLSWLREFTVIYWCASCHANFELNRHRSRLVNSQPVVGATPTVNGTTPTANAATAQVVAAVATG